MADAGAVLEATSIDFSYGRLQVLFDVTVAVAEREILALLGTNGAGKSTLLRVVAGLESPDRGTVRLRGQDITGDRAERRAVNGLVLVPAGRGVFPSMTVADNLRAGAFTFLYERRRLGDAFDRVLSQFPVLATKLSQTAGSLSGGEQHMLALAKAMLLDPSVLLIDELTGGLAPQIVDQLLQLLTGLRESGTTLVLVE